MSAVGYSIPEAARLHIRISDSDDDSDGEQANKTISPAKQCHVDVIPQPKESTDDLSQLAKTAQATAEAVMRVNDGLSTISTPTISTKDNVGAGDNINNLQQQQPPQMYYVPQAYSCPATPVTYVQQPPGSQISTSEISQNVLSNEQGSQSSLYQLPQLPLTQVPIIPNVPPGTVLYQMQAQSPLPSSQVLYQMPTTPQQVLYQIPNVQLTQPPETPNHQQTSNQPEHQQCMFETQRSSGDAGRSRRTLTIGDFIQSSTQEMVYPTVYVSPAGLLTVLLKHGVAVEMTLDRTIRVVNHKHKAVAASNSKGTASCIHHGMAKVYQDTTRCDAECFLQTRQLSITTDALKFACGINKCYKLNNRTYDFTIAYPDFKDLSQDMSVSLLFSSKQYGPQLIDAYQEVANTARYRRHKNGACTVYINGMKIYQYEKGDVVVNSGQRYIRVSPTYGSMMVGTHYVEMLLENAHTLKVRRGDYRFKATEEMIVMSGGYMECGMDKNNEVFCQLEILLVRTIIDNRQPCDISCTGSREAYISETNKPKPLPVVTSSTYNAYLPPPSFLQFLCDRYFRKQMGWCRRRGKSHYKIDLEKAIKLAKDEYEKKKSEKIEICAVAENEKSNVIDKESSTEDNKRGEDNMRDVKRISEAVQKLIDRNYKSQNDLVKANEFINDNKSTAVSNNDNEASARLWSSIVFAQDDTVTLDEDQTRTIPDSKKTERSSEKHVTMDVTHRAEKYENRKGKETTINSDQKKLRGYSEQRGNKSAHRRNSSETKNSKYLRKENQSPSKRKSFYFEQRELSEHENTDSTKQEKPDKYRENGKVCHRESNSKWKKNTKFHSKASRNEHNGNVNRTREKGVNKKQSKIKIEPKSFVASQEKTTYQGEISTMSTKAGIQKSAVPDVMYSCPSSRSPRDKMISPRECKSPRAAGKGKKRSPRSCKKASPRDNRAPKNDQTHTREKTTDPAEISTELTKTGSQQSAVPGVRLKNISLKISPRDKIISPRECRSPRAIGKGKKKRSPRSPGKASPRDNGLKPRRNKKKRSTRLYTDIPVETTEVICAKDDEKPMVSYIRGLQPSVKGDVNTENLVKTATVLVDTAVAEAMTIIRGTAGPVEKETNNEEIRKVASTVLKHVFYIVCHKWKLYYSHIQSTNFDSVEDTDDVTIDNDNLPQTNDINEVNNKIIWKNDDATASNLITDDCIPLTDGEAVKDELVHHIVGTTVSADHLETMSISRTPGRNLSHANPVLKKSEPNICLKKGQSLRLTKSDVMNSSTNSSVKVPHGIEAQNKSEGNTTQSTGRLKSTQKAVSKLNLNITTVGITTNEKGSGEAVEASASKTVAFTENIAIHEHIANT